MATKFQQDIYNVLTGALVASPVAGTWLGFHLYAHGWLDVYATVWGLLLPTVVLLAWLDTEVRWEKRTARARKVLARITGK